MRAFLAIILTCCFISSKAQSEKFSISSKSGVLFYDVFGNSEDVLNKIRGWSVGSEVMLSSRTSIRNFKMQFGIGFQFLRHMDIGFYTTPIVSDHPSRSELHTNYVTLTAGGIYNFKKRPLCSTFIDLGTNIVAHKHLINEAERRLYVDLEWGMIRKVGKKNEFSISLPFSLTPVFRQDANYFVLGRDFHMFKTFVEVIGVNLGYRRLI